MADLTSHPHLRSIEVGTPEGVVAYPAPAAIFVDQDRTYAPVPAVGEHSDEVRRDLKSEKTPS
jgi:formyl-CoA transferase